MISFYKNGCHIFQNKNNCYEQKYLSLNFYTHFISKYSFIIEGILIQSSLYLQLQTPMVRVKEQIAISKRFLFLDRSNLNLS